MILDSKKLFEAAKVLYNKYGVKGVDGEYMVATDVDGDLRIAAVSPMDKWLWDMGVVNANNFIKIKELIGEKEIISEYFPLTGFEDGTNLRIINE